MHSATIDSESPVEQQRLTELLMAISLAADLVAGQTFGQTLRASFLSASLADELGCTPDETRDALHVSLLYFIGCTADAGDTAVIVGGDEQAFNAAMAPSFMGSDIEVMSAFFRAIGAGQPLYSRLRLAGRALGDPDWAVRSLANHCDVAAMLAGRLGLGTPVVHALGHAYERWDGKGHPAGLRRSVIPGATRIAIVACDADLFDRLGDDPVAILNARAGHAYDPEVVDAFRRIGREALAAYDSSDGWQSVLEFEPDPHVTIPDSGLDDVLTVVADFADLKSRWTRGHSRDVAQLAERVGNDLGLDRDEQQLLRRAGLVHDIGRVGVPSGIWDKPGPLSIEDWERVQMHPYLTQRVLSRCASLRNIAEVAGSHHERLDGSGYHRGYRSEQLSIPARILAAADVFSAARSARPYRPAMSTSQAIDLVEDEVRAGRLDADVVSAITAPSGVKRSGKRRDWPNGLTDREVEVLRLIARGWTNREVADCLSVSPKTIGRHVEHIYTKAGVSTRAGAAVFAMEHQLLNHSV